MPKNESVSIEQRLWTARHEVRLFPPKSAAEWLSRACTWWHNYLGWLPVLQLECGIHSPMARTDTVGSWVPWWCPFLYCGVNNLGSQYIGKMVCANAEVRWLGVYVAAGVMVPIKWQRIAI